MNKKIFYLLVSILIVFTLCLTIFHYILDIDNFGTSPTYKEDKQSTTVVQNPDHDHIYELMVIEPPSCGVAGRQAYICIICGKRQYETIVAALPHNYKRSDALSSFPTCTTDGAEVYRCITCGCAQTEILEAIGHRWRTKINCDSNTNELIITPYCTVCQFVSSNEYRYKINDAEKLIYKNGQIAEYGGHRSSGGVIVEYYQKAPYYGVFCNDTYLLIVRNTEDFLWCSEFTSSDGARGYYTRLGCTVVYEATINITTDGRIQIVQ